jgi:hypothetical protein
MLRQRSSPDRAPISNLTWCRHLATRMNISSLMNLRELFLYTGICFPLCFDKDFFTL